VIRAGRAAYLGCGVLTARALAGWDIRAAGSPHNNAAGTTVPLAAPISTPAPASPAAGGEYGNGGAAGAGDPAAAAPVGSKTTKLSAKAVPRMGSVVVDDKGWVLYRFDKDTANPPAGRCTATWVTGHRAGGPDRASPAPGGCRARPARRT
jgi:hypothetical protein